MTEQMEEMIYREGYRKGYEKGREAATAELITWHDRVCEEMAKRHTADRPKGEWVEEGCAHGSEMCNQCGFVQFKGRTHNFCPYCGADMRGEDNAQR